MPVLRELITVLGFDVDDAGAAKAEKIFAGLKKGALAVVAAVGAGTIALGLMIRSTVAAGDEAAKTGKRLGLTAEEVQELAFAAERSGVGIAQLNQGLRSLQRRAADSIGQTNEFAKGFQRLGIRVVDANGKLKPTVQLFLEVADGFTKIADEGERTALAMKVAGDGGAALLPLFLEGAKGIEALRQRARSLGFVLDNETARAAEQVTDNFTDLRLLFIGITRRLASGLLPMIERFTISLIDLFIANRELIDRGIRVLGDVIETTIDQLSRMARFVFENRRFFLALAVVLTAALLPALFSIAGGYDGILKAAIEAAIGAGLPFIAFLALAALVALVMEDIFVFLSGGESAIGKLFEVFQEEAQKPDAHWMVLTLNAIISATRRAILDLDEFFKIWTAQSLASGGIVRGLGRTIAMAFGGMILLFRNIAKSIAKEITGTIGGAFVAAIPVIGPVVKAIAAVSEVTEEGARILERQAGGGGGRVAFTPTGVAPGPFSGGPSNISATFEAPRIIVNFNAVTGESDVLAAKIGDEIDIRNRNALRELESRLKR